MIDFLRLVGIEHDEKVDNIDELLESIVKEKEKVKKWLSSDNKKVIDIEKRCSKDISLLTRSLITEDGKLDIVLFTPLASGYHLTKCENTKVSYNKNNIAAFGFTESENSRTPVSFIVSNVEDYQKAKKTNAKVGGVYLTAYSIEATVILPIENQEGDQEVDENEEYNSDFIQNIVEKIEMDNDEEVLEMLEKELDEEMKVMRERLKSEDILSVLEVYFLPIEDFESMYSLLGIITEVEKQKLISSRGYIYRITVSSMSLSIDVYINERDLLGEPRVGMRFKGNVWVHGKIKFVG